MARDALVQQYACLVYELAAERSKILFDITRNTVLG
jgi:hypothetical protein